MVYSAGPRKRMGLITSRLLSGVLLLDSVACTELVAPASSKLDLLVAPPSVGADGGVAEVSAVVLEDDGDPVRDGTQVIFTTTAGQLRAVEHSDDNGMAGQQDTTFASGSTVLTTTNNGVAFAMFRADDFHGTVTIRGISGNIRDSAEVSVLGAEAAANAVLRIVTPADSQTIMVGDTVQILASLTDSSGAPLDGIVVRFSTAKSGLTRTVTIARGGAATTEFIGLAMGSAVVFARSGSPVDSVTILIN